VAKAPVKEEAIAIAGPLGALQKLLGDDLIGINVAAIEQRGDSSMNSEAVHGLVLILPVADINEMAGNSGRGSHGRTYQMGAAAGALAAFKIAVAG
jgi:hypothetical protein